MSKRTGVTLLWIYVASFVLHVALAVGAVALPKPKRAEVVPISLAEVKKSKPKPPPKPPPPPPPPTEKPKPLPPPPPQQAQAKVAQEAKLEDAPPPVPLGADGFADLGTIPMGNSGSGVPIPQGAKAGGPSANAGGGPAATATATTHKVQALAPAGPEACTDPLVRPKRKIPVSPKYTMEARQADIEGVVRIEVTVDESGRVIAARVLSGLGYGLDESALAAAKASTFEPATKCGKPMVGTVVIPFRFEMT
jgi:protein TonB